MKMTYNFYDTCSLLTKGTLLEDLSKSWDKTNVPE